MQYCESEAEKLRGLDGIRLIRQAGGRKRRCVRPAPRVDDRDDQQLIATFEMEIQSEDILTM